MPVRPRALVAAVGATLLGALLTALLPATAAQGASRTVQGGRLDWGIRSSFQSYVTGPIAKGSYALTGGAATVGGGRFRFHSATGTYDGDTGTFRAAFSGGVHFLGHRGADGTYELDLTLSRPTVRISGGSGTLYVDVTGRAKGTGTVTTSTRVPFAALSLGGVDMRGGGTAVRLRDLPATLTAQGARSFAGYYAAGTALDPVSLSADVRAAATAAPSATPEATKPPAPRRAAGGTPDAIADGAVDWGVRRTFREYVTGDIADGKWTLTGGARDGGALFRFPAGEGTYGKKDRTLHAAFAGAVRFTGDHGLDLRLAGLRVTVEDGRGTLYADVTGTAFTGKRVPLVTFTAGDLAPKNGLVQLAEAPARLSAPGAKAFGGMYRAGTAMDPVTLSVAVTDDARLPALPDLGSSDPPTPESERRSTAAPHTENTASDDAHSSPAPPLGLAAGLLLATGLVLALVRRRRTRRAGTVRSAGDED
ncbi:HtaA domain-containing protein [Streptomyces sp. NPDC001083]|uniref:HtaA domain-containing protein n=1 Tax=Streptomyces sp. NPDC001083 TaxID=3364545 RepID=UPI00367C9738